MKVNLRVISLWVNVLFLFVAVIATMFIPVASCDVVYDNARAACEGNAFDALRLAHYTKNNIDFYVYGNSVQITLAFCAAVSAVVAGSFRKGAILSIVLYITTILLLGDGVKIFEFSQQHMMEGMTEYSGVSWFIFADLVFFAFVFIWQRLLIYRVGKIKERGEFNG